MAVKRWILGGVVAAVLAGTSCQAPVQVERADEVVEVPASWGEEGVEGLSSDQWCSDFGEESLDRLVGRTWRDNLDLKAAWARLEQADAVASEASAPLWPQASVTGGWTRSKQSLGAVEGPAGVPSVSSEARNRFTLGASASYEFDLWGKYRERAAAAELDREATRAAAEALAITLTAQVGEAWFDVVAQRERLALLDEQVAISQEYLELTRLRFARGLATGLDLTQQAQNLESLRGQRAGARSGLELAEHRLAVLTGRSPGVELEVGAVELPDLPSLPELGVPADLLEQRPDVRAAKLRLEAADARTAAEVADLLPTLRLSVNLSYQAEELGKLFDSLFYSLGAEVAQSIFQGNRRRAQVDRAESAAEEQLYNYGSTLLGAMREVRDALVLEARQAEFVESLREQVEVAESSLEVARSRYRQGGLGYLRVLTSLQSLQAVERALLDARRQQFSHRISLCRSLGGTWVRELDSSIEEASEPDNADARGAEDE